MTTSCDPITLEEATDMFTAYKAAALAVSKGQSYSIDGRSLTRGDLKEINNQLQYWRGQVARLCLAGTSGPTVRRAIPHG